MPMNQVLNKISANDKELALMIMVNSYLNIKMLQQQRHTGMDCRYPDYMDVMFTCLPWHLGSGNPCRNDEPFALAEASC